MKSKPNVEEYLQRGIHGEKIINPEERNKFLGALRERVVLVLTQQQVLEPGTYQEVDKSIKSNPQATLYLNGNISYSYLSDYLKLATKYNCPYTIVNNNESTLGLVLANDYAIDKENIYITNSADLQNDEKENNPFARFFKNLFQ